MTELSIQSILRVARENLKTVSDSPSLDAELLLAHCLDKNRTFLHTWPEKIVPINQRGKFESLLEKRLTGYPVAYLLGVKNFWTLELIVTPDVLIPRPETELLVETALEKIKDISNPKVLDLGTGSGAIALALASERPDANIIACDVSDNALSIAKQNALKHELDNNIEFIKSNWFENIKESQFDLIVSNPPYIQSGDPHLQEETRFEPQHALISESLGLKDITNILKHAPIFMKKHAWLIIEHGFEQAESVKSLVAHYNYKKNYVLKDLAGRDRLTVAQ